MSDHNSKKQRTLNMTEGNTLKLLITFAIPMLIGNIFQQLYNLVDSVVVGKFVGADALAAIGATGSITFLFFAICNGIGSGGGVITSQCFGSGETDEVKSCIANVGYVMFLFPIIVGVIAFSLAKPILTLLETPAEILPDALIYLRIMCVGIVFVSIYNYISSMLRALGDSRTPLYFLIFSCILNTFLDVLFVKSFEMGVKGAAVATLISQFTSGLLCILYALRTNPYFKFGKHNLRYNRHVLSKTLKLGIPFSLQFLLIAISCMALQKVVNGFGPVTMAAFTATSRIEQLIHQPYQTLSAALSTYTGQNYGAGRYERVKDGYKKSIYIMVVFTVLMVPLIQLFGNAITSLFVDEQEVIEMGGQALRITSLFYVFLGTIYTIRGVLNGLADGGFALLNGIIEVVGRFTVPIFLTGIASIGVWGIWWATGIVWFFAGATAWLRYIHFKKKALAPKTIEEN